jgi:hypothetical protein
MIDPVKIRVEIEKGNLQFWIKDGVLYCGDTDPRTTTVMIPYSRKAIDGDFKSE